MKMDRGTCSCVWMEERDTLAGYHLSGYPPHPHRRRVRSQEGSRDLELSQKTWNADSTWSQYQTIRSQTTTECHHLCGGSKGLPYRGSTGKAIRGE